MSFYHEPKQSVEQIVELPFIWDVIMGKKRHCNDYDITRVRMYI